MYQRFFFSLIENKRTDCEFCLGSSPFSLRVSSQTSKQMAMSFSLPFPPRLPMSLWSPSDPSSSSSSSLAAARGITSSSAHLLAVASASGVRDFLHHHSAGHLRLERLIASLLGAHKSPHFYGEGDILFGVPWKDSTVNSLLGTLSKAQTSFMYLFSGQGLGNRENQRRLRLENGNPKGSSGDVRWTNVLLALNIAAYLAQLATRGKLLLWGAKVNSLIDQGQIWRLATSSFLHANLIHLMVNCYSLNNVGPTMEKLLGKKRFLAVYLASAVAGSAMSYFFSKSPAVGASGAIFGLVGSSALFFLRHKNLIKSGEQEAKEIMRIVGLNIIFGLSTPGIDNWGHVGGLLGGIAVSWFLGPAWQPEIGDNGKPVLRDQAPVFKLIGTKKTG